MCTVDASKAIAKLGLKEPVVFEFCSLNDDDPLMAILGTASTTAGRTRPTPDDVHHIQIDVNAVAFTREALPHIIAHELYHCKQFEDAGSYLRAAIELVYQNTHVPYEKQPGEREAESHTAELEDLITVSGCEAHFPVTVDDTAQEIEKMKPYLQSKYPSDTLTRLHDIIGRV